jgi:hypothetical protein
MAQSLTRRESLRAALDVFSAFRQIRSGVRWAGTDSCSYLRMNDLAMHEPVTLLTLEFLTWIASRPRTYAEAMEAWASTCPRNSVWDDALIDGLILVESADTMNQSKVILTPLGRAVLNENSQSQVVNGNDKKK